MHPLFAAAADATTYYPLSPLPGLATGTSNLTTYLNSVFTVTISVAAMLAVIMIVVGGFQWMTSEAVTDKEAGKKTITHAVLGLVLLLGSYLILNVIDPRILQINIFDTDLKGVAPNGGSGGSGVISPPSPQESESVVGNSFTASPGDSNYQTEVSGFVTSCATSGGTVNEAQATCVAQATSGTTCLTWQFTCSSK